MFRNLAEYPVPNHSYNYFYTNFNLILYSISLNNYKHSLPSFSQLGFITTVSTCSLKLYPLVKHVVSSSNNN